MGTPRPCYQCKLCGHLVMEVDAWFYKAEDNSKFIAHTQNKHQEEWVIQTLADPKFDIRTQMYKYLR